MNPKRLFLYEEIMLLALHNQKGTLASYAEHAVAGAVLAELSLEKRISLDGTRKQLVDLHNGRPIGDPIIEECVQIMKAARKRAPLGTWVSRLAGIKRLRHKVAERLCHRGILRTHEDKVLLMFKRRIYPEVNPGPEREVIERLRTAIFAENDRLDPRTIVLISLARGPDLLSAAFGRKEIKTRKKRIEQIVNGEMIGKATKEVIDACQAAIMASVIMPVIIAGSSSH